MAGARIDHVRVVRQTVDGRDQGRAKEMERNASNAHFSLDEQIEKKNVVPVCVYVSVCVSLICERRHR